MVAGSTCNDPDVTFNSGDCRKFGGCGAELGRPLVCFEVQEAAQQRQAQPIQKFRHQVSGIDLPVCPRSTWFPCV